MPKYSKERTSVKVYMPIEVEDTEIKRLLQKNGEYLIITGKSTQKKKNRHYYEGHFEGYNRKLIFSIEQAREGKIWNPEKPDEYGFYAGTYNVDKYIYNIWKNMERRCYYVDYPSYQAYGAKGITVSDEFKSYVFFENWYKANWDGYTKLEIDKDVKSNGECKIYSPLTCILIPAAINTFISTLGEMKGIEVKHNTNNDTYCVHYRRKFKKINKNFKTLEEAKAFKKDLDKQYLELLFTIYSLNDNIKNLLRNYVEVSLC